MSSVERIVAMEDMNPKTIAVGFPLPRGKISSDFLLVELAAVDVAVFPLSRHLGSGDCPSALQWDPRLSQKEWVDARNGAMYFALCMCCTE